MYPSDFWDQRYAAEQYVYGETPNAFFKECLTGLKPGGRILLLAEGEGRNAVFAACLGRQVTAVDFSAAGREKALLLAEKQGVSIHYQLADIQHWDPVAEGPWDEIALIYAHFPAEWRRRMHRACVKALQPGGHLILEAFNPRQLSLSSGGPKDPAMLYTLDMLKEDFQGLTLEYGQELSIDLDEGPFHRGQAEIVRYHGHRSNP